MNILGKHLCGFLKRRFEEAFFLEKNFEELNREEEHLSNKKARIERKINEDTVSKMPTPETSQWLDYLRRFETEYSTLCTDFEEYRQLPRKWFAIWQRVCLGRRVATQRNEISRLKEEAKFEDGVMVDAPLQNVERVHAPQMKSETSTARTVKKILKCLEDDQVQKIGVWGMGGVGKTTVVKMLNNLPEIESVFEIVIWVTVSKDGNVRKIQNQIAQRLNLRVGNCGEESHGNNSVRRQILGKLQNKKWLLILDDMWDNVDLEGVGIPSQSRGTGSKIVLTTRSFNVCNKMETDEEIKVDVLLKKEAWELFREVVSQVVDAPEIQGIAKQIVEKCRGLPLTIKVIGGFLRKKKDVHVWKNALYEMSSAKYEIIDDMEDSVFKILKFSYDQLKTKRKKNCFLYCALFPEDSMIKIGELIYYWVGEGFISDGVVQSLDDAINRGYTIVDELCNASLLEFTKDRHGDKCVKVHDVIRDLALRITSPATSTLDNFPSDEGESGIFLVRARVEMEDPPCVEEWKQKHRISLMENGNLYYLPDRPQCDSLLTLLLQKNSKLERIPESFFEHMHNLRVLDISKTGIDDLPPSISCLVNLRGLYAMYTGLRKCPSQIGCLRSLEVLHLGGGEMEYLPTEVGQLTRLRSLIVIFSRYGGSVVVEGKRMIPRGMLSRLSLLEDLRVDNVGPGLDEDWVEIGESIAEEVDSLNKLTRLEMNFPKLDSYLKFVQESFAVKTQRLKTSHLSIGYHVKDQMSFSPLVDVGEHRLRFLDSIELLPNDDIRVTVSRATKLFLEGCTTPRKLSDLGMENFKGIKEIYIKGCERVESVIDGNDLNDSFMATHCQVLPNLQTLDLSNLDNLRSIWEGAAPPQSLNQLTSIHVYCCDNLPFIFSRCMILHLPNLQTLHVSNCLRVEEIVKEEEEEGEEKNEMVGSSSNQVDDHHDFVHLPCLSKLSLVCLPKLRRVCKRVRLALPPSVQIFISSCPEVIKQGFEWWEDDGSNSSNILHMEWDSTVVTGWREKIVKRKKMI